MRQNTPPSSNKLNAQALTQPPNVGSTEYYSQNSHPLISKIPKKSIPC